MNKKTKSADYNRELKLQKFLSMYRTMRHFDSIILMLNDTSYRSDSCMTSAFAEESICKLEQMQRELIVRMMALNVELKYKDKTVDSYLQHMVYTLGL